MSETAAARLATLPSAIMISTCVLAYIMMDGSLFIGIPVLVSLLAAPYIPWRFNISKRMSEWLYLILALPFILLAMASGNKRDEFDPQSLAAIYLLCLAVQEAYRDPRVGRPVVVHLSLIGVLFHAGMNYQLKAYPVFVLVYLAAALMLFRQPTRPTPLAPAAARFLPTVLLIVGLGLAAGVGGGLSYALPVAERSLVNHFNDEMFAFHFSLMGPLRESQLGSLKDSKNGNTVVARFWGSNPVYLRAHVMTKYGAGRWFGETLKPITLADPVVPSTLPFGDRLSSDMGSVMCLDPLPKVLHPQAGTLLAEASTIVLTPPGTYAIQAAGLFGLKMDPYGIFVFQGPAATECGIVWDPAPHEDYRGPDPGDAQYLQVPEGLRDRIGALARRVVGSTRDPRRQAEVIHQWLLSDGRYVRDPPHREGVDPVDTFLFETKQGYCEYFATGMALMLRSLGVPCRYVLGYLVTEYNETGGYHVVRGRHAHAWLEAHLAGKGWVAFDPTPPAELSELSQRTGGLLQDVVDQYTLWFTRFWAGVDSGNWKSLARKAWAEFRAWLVTSVGFAATWIGIPFMVVMTLLRARTLARGWRAGQRKQAEVTDLTHRRLRNLLQRAEGRLVRAGYVRPPHVTLSEYAGDLPDADAREVLLLYCAYRYGARLPSPEMLARLETLFGLTGN